MGWLGDLACLCMFCVYIEVDVVWLVVSVCDVLMLDVCVLVCRVCLWFVEWCEDVVRIGWWVSFVD